MVKSDEKMINFLRFVSGKKMGNHFKKQILSKNINHTNVPMHLNRNFSYGNNFAKYLRNQER